MLNPGMILLTVFALVCLVLLTYIFVYIPRMKGETEEGFIVPFGAGVPACWCIVGCISRVGSSLWKAGMCQD